MYFVLSERLKRLKMKTEYDILSPDGFSISSQFFNSIPEAEKAFKDWAKRYEKQGYYSSNNRKIPLTELRNHCRLITV